GHQAVRDDGVEAADGQVLKSLQVRLVADRGHAQLLERVQIGRTHGGTHAPAGQVIGILDVRPRGNHNLSAGTIIGLREGHSLLALGRNGQAADNRVVAADQESHHDAFPGCGHKLHVHTEAPGDLPRDVHVEADQLTGFVEHIKRRKSSFDAHHKLPGPADALQGAIPCRGRRQSRHEAKQDHQDNGDASTQPASPLRHDFRLLTLWMCLSRLLVMKPEPLPRYSVCPAPPWPPRPSPTRPRPRAVASACPRAIIAATLLLPGQKRSVSPREAAGGRCDDSPAGPRWYRRTGAAWGRPPGEALPAKPAPPPWTR